MRLVHQIPAPRGRAGPGRRRRGSSSGRRLRWCRRRRGARRWRRERLRHFAPGPRRSKGRRRAQKGGLPLASICGYSVAMFLVLGGCYVLLRLVAPEARPGNAVEDGRPGGEGQFAKALSVGRKAVICISYVM